MIELVNINKTYKTGEAEVHALCEVSLKINSGEFVAIMGASGSGKSTLLHILGFLDRADSGSYFLNGRNVNSLTDDEFALLRSNLAGFVFQQFHLLPRMTALENVALPLIYGGKKEFRKNAEEKMEMVGLTQRASHRPNQLSGGQQQRVAIARTLVREPLFIFADEPTGNLDTKSAEEITEIFKNLNRQEGKTVILVTHEKDIAQQASRIILMRNGSIVSDQPNDNRLQKSGTVPERISSGDSVSERGTMFSADEILDNLRQGINAIFSNKMRSFLSMLGILIGVSSVIAMLALGEGAKESISTTLSSLGTNILHISPGAQQRGHLSLEAGAVTRFTLQDAEAIAKIPQVKKVSPLASGRGQVVYGNKNWNTQIQGVGENYAEMRALTPFAGRFFTAEESKGRQKVALLGLTVAKEIFGGSDPVGELIRVNRINFRVIGVLPEKGSGPGGDQDDTVMIPVTTAMYRVLGRKYVNSIDAEINDLSLMEEAKNSIHNLIVKRQHLDVNKPDSFNIRNMAEIQEALKSMTKTMTTLLGFIATISLLVGGIGIMNIMLVSVTERTREIGLRKALGARRKDIMFQFLTESVVMTLLGGIIGIVFGIIAAALMSVFAGWTTKVSVFSVVLAAGFSIAVGLCFGIWPARKAVQMDPIEALRYE